MKHKYTLEGAKILREVWGENTLISLYDNEDGVCGILYNNVPYYFIKNLQGDVIAIVDKDAQTVARYSYDAWGVCTVTQDSVGIANVNPFRYRSYYFDQEIGMYYLQSRYFDPQVGRFINGDELLVGFMNMILTSSSNEANMYCYCSNDCVEHSDNYGYLKIKISTASIIVDAIILVVQIGAAIVAMKSTWKMAKLFFKSAEEKTKKKLISAVKELIGSKYWKILMKAVFSCVFSVGLSIADFIVDLFLNMSLSYAILRAIYEFIPASRKFLIL